ncbi:TonB-dependent receptor [Gallaecimonas pentaromativorans]|uniref:Iron complex outermembrane receptor protein n=1 Tax=Gallaecimonas pentaromativorans TaxID=584787 RepID=A0A3N1P4N2_9GAMM|nr:TonB-dependent receptor [Gallaecimonas pentaromativorans]ROQ22431.1 iron complex outermembrane receptor protein [Gallaecimonas pentaromativorans]
MKFAPLYLALAAAGLATPAFAAVVTGTVSDASGSPIVGAAVSVDGAATQAVTDKNGNYSLKVADNSHLHLHAGADNFAHSEVEIDTATGSLSKDFVLAPVNVENIVVTGSPLGRTALESTTPVSVLSDDALRKATAPSLGDTLENQPGVQASHFGPAASRPIIRGMDGPRVQVLENGLGVGDASTVSADHAVTTEASTARQIEILRGPATLLYGNGAIGGVVNVVDYRYSDQPIDGMTGSVGARYSTVDDGKTAVANLNTGNGKYYWHVDGTHRRASDEDIPGQAIEGVDNPSGKLANSQLSLDDFGFGTGYTGDDGYIGVSGSRTENKYGIPPSEAGSDEPTVSIDMRKTAWQLHSGLNDPFKGFKSLKFDGGYTHYTHAELENGDPDTVFTNKYSEGRVTLANDPWGEWQGVVGLHATHRDYRIDGEESLTPNTKTDSVAAFIVQERKVGDFRYQLGGRLENYHLKSGSMDLESLAGDQQYSPSDIKDNDLSLSAGTVWDFTPGYNLSVSLSRAERSATAEELYSYGPHDATRTFEVGSLYDINGGNVIPVGSDPKQETANNLDLTLRKFDGAWSGTLSVFYNKVDNYFYEHNTGLVASDLGDVEDGDLPVYQFSQADATLYGFEAQVNVPIGDYWSIDAMSDYTRGKLKDGGNLPRISPLRVGSTLNFDYQDWHADVGATAYSKQDKTAENETDTAGYTLVNASVGYHVYQSSGDLFVFLQGNNLTDKEARPATSFLKDTVPLPGRNLTLGVRYSF